MKSIFRLLCTGTMYLGVASAHAETWTYFDDTDKMRGTTIKYASLDSENKVSPGSYYSASTELSIVLRQENKQQRAVIKVLPKGQLWCSYENCTVAIKFDNEKPVRWSMSKAQSGHSEMLFFDNEARLLAKLKGSKTAIIEVVFFDKGTYQFEFKTAGLEWGESSAKKKM